MLAAWRREHDWPTDLQVEQDLLLSQMAVLIAQHPALGNLLAWRGGTSLHKLHLSRPLRFSVDLDYVLVGKSGSTGWLLDALRIATADSPLEIASWDFRARSVRVVFAGITAAGVKLRLKVEVNTTEVAPVFELIRIAHVVDTRWWSGSAEILTFEPAELVGTKFRALAERRKGRDLWDLWLARRELAIDDQRLAIAGAYYLKAAGVAPGEFRRRLLEHIYDEQFRSDLDSIIAGGMDGYDITEVGNELITWSEHYLR